MGTLQIRQPLLQQLNLQQLDLTKVVPTWSPLLRMLFRFVFVYLLLCVFFGGNAPLQFLWNPVVHWVGEQVFQADVTMIMRGSGDTTWDYVQLFCFLVLSLAATGVWTLLDRKRLNYDRLNLVLRTIVRFWLAFSMIVYGTVKIIPVQMPSPTLERLLEPFGDASPMGLLWTFMGASAAYTMFTGAAEMLGGLLLIARRTTLLGAMVCCGVMANVVMLNFCYDVPVKLVSSHLLVMAIFLIVPDLRRLGDLFLFQRRPAPIEIRPLFTGKVAHRAALIVRTAFFSVITLLLLVTSLAMHQMYTTRPPLHGIWNVEQFEVDGQIQPPLLTDATQWRQVIFSSPGVIGIHHMKGAPRYYALELDAAKNTLALTKGADTSWQSTLTYTETAPESLTVEGVFDGHTIRVKLQRSDESQFLLTNRGFHWINEVPFNK